MKNAVSGFVVATALCAASADARALPTWDKVIDNGWARFKVLSRFGGEAVLDRETGLVWERSPGAEELPWGSALDHCIEEVVGNRRGWRLPTIQELATLDDPSSASEPSLPAGHPFTDVQSGTFYWSATSAPSGAWSFVFEGTGPVLNGDANLFLAWCVRSGHGGPDEQ